MKIMANKFQSILCHYIDTVTFRPLLGHFQRENIDRVTYRLETDCITFAFL